MYKEVFPNVSVPEHDDRSVCLPHTLPEVGAAFSGVRAQAIGAIWLAMIAIGLASFAIALVLGGL